MHRKTILALALTSALAFSTSAIYADDGKQEAPKPELNTESAAMPQPMAEGDEKPTQPAPELIADGDEKPSQPAPELVADGDEKPSHPAPQLIADGDEKPSQPAPELIVDGDGKPAQPTELIA